MISAALAVIENEGQRNELSKFYENNKARLYNIALKILHNSEEPEDAVQEAFSRIANKPDTFFSLDDSKRILYVCSIVKNVAVDNYKLSIKKENLYENIPNNNELESFDKLMIDNISHQEMIDFIKGLPALQQNVLILTRLSKLSISETARILNVSEKVVNQRLYLARKSIKKFISDRRKNNV